MPLFRSKALKKVEEAGYDPARLPPGQYLISAQVTATGSGSA